MLALFCLLKITRLRQSTTSAALRVCSGSGANKCECSEALRRVLTWKHARRPFSCLTASLKCRRTASRKWCASARSCLFITMPCALANERICYFWCFPVHSIICCSKQAQRPCSERSRSQSNKTRSSSVSWKKSSVDVSS